MSYDWDGVFSVAPNIVLLVIAHLSLALRFTSLCANKILYVLPSFTRQDDFSSLAVDMEKLKYLQMIRNAKMLLDGSELSELFCIIWRF